MTVTNPHAEPVRNAMSQLKEYAANLEGWNLESEKDGVKLYNKTVDNSPIAVVRGEVVLEGHEFTAHQIASVATQPGARKIWDEKFDSSEVKEVYSKHESLFWGKVKTPWPISPRDMSATSLKEFSQDECYYVMISVEDEAVPLVSGCVRSHLYISGWKIIKTDAGISLTYITQVDLAGSIPTAFVKSVQQQVPLCAGLVVQYAKDYGYPPTTAVEGSAEFKSENFDHAKREYVSNVDGNGDSKWLISKKMYPNGVKVTIIGSGDAATHQIVEAENGNSVVEVTGINGPTTVKITKA